MKKILLIVLTAALLYFPNEIFGQAPPLGSTSGFALFTASGAFSNVGASTVVKGDVGTNVGAFSAFPPGILIGTAHVADPATAQAATDIDLAYGFVSTVTCGSVISTTLGNGQSLLPNVYCLGAASTINGDLVLDGLGDPTSLFIFKIDGALATTVNSRVLLTNSASMCNVYWQVNGEVDLGDNSTFQGTLLVNGAIHILQGATLLGRGLSKAGAIALHDNIVTLSLQPTAPIISPGGSTTFCAGGSVTLSGNVDGTWSNGATTSSITIGTGGDYFVVNTTGCGSDTSNHIIVTVNSLPGCTITGNGSICTGGSTQLCAPAGLSSYSWSKGASTQCITVNAAGTYSVTTNNGGGCSSTCSKDVIENNNPGCTITGNGSICTGGSTQLCAPAGLSSYSWSTGASTQCITVNAAGTYSVTTNNGGGCSSTCSKNVIENNNPGCTITGNGSICTGGSTQLCAPAGLSSYSWSTGASTQCITVNAAGTYSVTTNNGGGCSSTCSKNVIENNNPDCTITGNGSICTGGSTQLCAPAGLSSYSWSTGATTQCITVNAAGTYSVTTTNGGACSSMCSKQVTVNQLPNCTITGNGSICSGGSTQLCAPAGLSSYSWSTGATTQCITVNAAGTYSVTTTNGGACSSMCSKQVTVNQLPNCTITGNGSICSGGSTQLCAPAGLSSYSWSTGASTQCITVNAAGTYSVTTTNGGACSSMCTKQVTVNQLPNCTITGSSTICEGLSTQLCAPAGLSSYSWSTGATTQCITANAAGTYSVTTNGSGCTSMCSKAETIVPCGGGCQWCNKSAVLSQVWQNPGKKDHNSCVVPDILVDVRMPHGGANDVVMASEIGTGIPATWSIQVAVDYVNLHGDPSPVATPDEIFIGVTASDGVSVSPTDSTSCGNSCARPPSGDTPYGKENVIIQNKNSARLNIFGCSVTMWPADASKPVVTIQNSVGKVTVLDIHVKYSHVQGYLIKGNAGLVVVKNSSSWYNDIGVDIQDDNVEYSGAQHVNGNRIGIWVEGNNNILRTNSDVINNTYYGIVISGSGNESNGNEVGTNGNPNANGILVNGSNNSSKGVHDGNVSYNTGYGINVTGNGNLINQVDVEYNSGKGIAVSGKSNTVNKCTKIDNNGSHGIYITGAANILSGNESDKNHGDGINANIGNGATGNNLSKNVAKSNMGYGIRACGQTDGGSNSASGNILNPQISFTCSSFRLASTETNNSFEFYPNPTQGNATISFTSESNNRYLIYVLDMTGRILYSEVVAAQEGRNSHDIDLSNVAKGIYMLILENENTREQKRIILQ